MASTSMRLAMRKARDGLSATSEMVADEALRVSAVATESKNIRESIDSSHHMVDSHRMDSERTHLDTGASAEGTGELIDVSDPVLVTGSTGFLGTRVVANLLRRGFRNIRCFTRRF